MDTAIEPSATPPIPRRVLFGNPHRANPKLSPDGKLLAYAAPHEGVMNVWVQPLGGLDFSKPARPVTADRGRGITAFTVCAGGRLVYAQDADGDENTRLYVLDLATGDSRLVTPEQGVMARVLAYRPSCRPDQMLLALNADNPQIFDVYELDLPTGELTKIASNPGHDGAPAFGGWLADPALRVFGGFVPTPDGGAAVWIRDGADETYRQVIEICGEDFDPVTGAHLTWDGEALFMTTSLGAPAKRLVRVDTVTGDLTTIVGDPHLDLVEVWWDPVTLDPVVAAYAPDRAELRVIDPAWAQDVERLTELDGGDVRVESTDSDGRLLLVASSVPSAPVRYYLYDRKNGQARYLFPHHHELADYRLARMEPVRFTARDGRELHGYLTLPVDAPETPLPAVVRVHGGPWMRDYWQYHPEVQWLANRGYAVIQINYRGSAGYGKDHLNAGNGEWGRAMQTDLLDAVTHLAAEGVIDSGRVGIVGASYGGYAALCAATFNQETFRCAVSVCGPVDLSALINSFPPYAVPMIAFYHARVGHPEHDADRLRQVSPLAHADQIRMPLLIAEGANDPRVKSHTDALAAALKRNGVPHRYLLFPDEGHGLVQPANRETFYAAAETFLAGHLGGACENPHDQPSAAAPPLAGTGAARRALE